MGWSMARQGVSMGPGAVGQGSQETRESGLPASALPPILTSVRPRLQLIQIRLPSCSGHCSLQQGSLAISVHVPFSEHLRALLFPARQQLATVTIMLQNPQNHHHHQSSGAYTNKHSLLTWAGVALLLCLWVPDVAWARLVALLQGLASAWVRHRSAPHILILGQKLKASSSFGDGRVQNPAEIHHVSVFRPRLRTGTVGSAHVPLARATTRSRSRGGESMLTLTHCPV